MIKLLKVAVRNALFEKLPLGFDRNAMLYHAWGHIYNNRMRGDYLEFGVYKGDSIIYAYKNYLKFKKWNRNQLYSKEKWRVGLAKQYLDYAPIFYGFDSFSGLPTNLEENNSFQQGFFDAKLSEVQEKLDKIIPNPALELIKGSFAEIKELPSSIDKIAIVNIDSDLYESALIALKLCETRLQIGSVVLFDEFHGFNSNENLGERRALREFSDSTGIIFDTFFDYGFGGRSFLITNI